MKTMKYLYTCLMVGIGLALLSIVMPFVAACRIANDILDENFL